MIRVAVRASPALLVPGLLAAGCATTSVLAANKSLPESTSTIPPSGTSTPTPVASAEPKPTPASTSVQLHVIGSVLTSGENLSRAKRIPTQSFGPQDYIVFVVDMGWDDPNVGAGKHGVEWRWYLNEKLVSRAAKTLTFATTPFPLSTRRAASALGAGHFKVETVVDGRVVASSGFAITQ